MKRFSTSLGKTSDKDSSTDAANQQQTSGTPRSSMNPEDLTAMYERCLKEPFSKNDDKNIFDNQFIDIIDKMVHRRLMKASLHTQGMDNASTNRTPNTTRECRLSAIPSSLSHSSIAVTALENEKPNELKRKVLQPNENVLKTPHDNFTDAIDTIDVGSRLYATGVECLFNDTIVALSKVDEPNEVNPKSQRDPNNDSTAANPVDDDTLVASASDTESLPNSVLTESTTKRADNKEESNLESESDAACRHPKATEIEPAEVDRRNMPLSLRLKQMVAKLLSTVAKPDCLNDNRDDNEEVSDEDEPDTEEERQCASEVATSENKGKRWGFHVEPISRLYLTNNNTMYYSPLELAFLEDSDAVQRLALKSNQSNRLVSIPECKLGVLADDQQSDIANKFTFPQFLKTSMSSTLNYSNRAASALQEIDIEGSGSLKRGQTNVLDDSVEVDHLSDHAAGGADSTITPATVEPHENCQVNVESEQEEKTISSPLYRHSSNDIENVGPDVPITTSSSSKTISSKQSHKSTRMRCRQFQSFEKIFEKRPNFVFKNENKQMSSNRDGTLPVRSTKSVLKPCQVKQVVNFLTIPHENSRFGSISANDMCNCRNVKLTKCIDANDSVGLRDVDGVQDPSPADLSDSDSGNEAGDELDNRFGMVNALDALSLLSEKEFVTNNVNEGLSYEPKVTVERPNFDTDMFEGESDYSDVEVEEEELQTFFVQRGLIDEAGACMDVGTTMKERWIREAKREIARDRSMRCGDKTQSSHNESLEVVLRPKRLRPRRVNMGCFKRRLEDLIISHFRSGVKELKLSEISNDIQKSLSTEAERKLITPAVLFSSLMMIMSFHNDWSCLSVSPNYTDLVIKLNF